MGGGAPAALRGLTMALPRFHVPEAAPGARVHFPEHTAHHAREVLRLRPGAAVRVFDGEGNEYEASLDSVSRNGVTARLGGPAPALPEPLLRIVLAVSPLKGDLMEWVIQKATELGVAEVRPVVMARTDAVARPALRGSRQERWDKVSSGAAEQCGRAVVPRIGVTTTLEALLAEDFPGLRLVLRETQDAPPLRASEARPSSVLVLVGPAGGLDPREVERLAAAGFRPVSLGPRILRSETAAVTAIAALQLLWGDLG
jgi:16S rRNA (uracil1498-N3)-methyltransferase